MEVLYKGHWHDGNIKRQRDEDISRYREMRTYQDTQRDEDISRYREG